MGNAPQKKWPLEELLEKAKPALENPELVRIVKKNERPTKAANEAEEEGYSKELIQVCRWLAIMKRDYPDQFSTLTTKQNQRKERGMSTRRKSQEPLKEGQLRLKIPREKKHVVIDLLNYRWYLISGDAAQKGIERHYKITVIPFLRWSGYLGLLFTRKDDLSANSLFFARPVSIGEDRYQVFAAIPGPMHADVMHADVCGREIYDQLTLITEKETLIRTDMTNPLGTFVLKHEFLIPRPRER